MLFNVCQSLCLLLSLCTLTFAISSTTKPSPVTVKDRHGGISSRERNGGPYHLRPDMIPTHQGAQSIASPRLVPLQAPNITNAPAMVVSHSKPTAPAFHGRTVTVTQHLTMTATHTQTATKTLTVRLPKTICQRKTQTKPIILSDGVAVSTKYSLTTGDAPPSYGKRMRKFSAAAGVVVTLVMILFF